MARDYYNETTKSNPWTKKKKDEDKKETGSTKPSQSSSSSNSTSAANNVIEKSKNSTFMGGGSSVKSVSSSSSSSSSSRTTSTQQSNPPVQTTESRVKSAADKRATATQKRYSEPIGPSTQRTETRRSLLDRADDFFRTFTEKSNEWEKNNVPARMTPERRTQIDTKNRTAAQNVSQRYQDRMGISDEDKALADYTAGVIKRKALGYAKTASKAVQTNEGKQFSGRWAQEDPEFARHISSHDFAQRADKAFNDYSAQQEKTQKRLTQIENNTSEAGRIALQAYGSGIEMGIDRLAGPLWAASMFASVYGNQRGNALAEGATDEQDARAAFLSAGLEVATEYMFRPAVGIASKFGGPHSLDFASKLASRVSGKLTGRAAKLADIGIRTLGSMAEENVEELVGWIADPYLQNAAYKNELQKTREEQAHADYNEMQSAFWSQFGTEEEAQEAALHVNSDDFVNELTETYRSSGASEEEARSMAKIMQKYFLAHFDNDEKAAKEAEEAMDAFVVGDVRAHHSWKELAETFASTSLLTGLTGGASAYSTYQMGNQILNSPNGKIKVEDYSNLVQNFDEENTKEAKGIKETIKNGDTPTGTQVYQVASQATEVMSELDQKNTASNQVKDRRMKSEGLTVSPVVMTPQGPIMNEMTEQAYQASYEKTQGVIRGIRKHGVDAGLDEDVLTDRDTMNTAAHLVAAFETGTITAEEIATELTVDHPEMRTIFEMATGVDLSQYDVQKDGGFYNEVDAVKSNRAMLDGLLAQSSDNYVQMAQAEQKQWENRTRGEVHKAMTNSFGAMGNLAMHPVLKTADTTDQGKYMLTARMAQRVYDYARRTDDEWNDIKRSLKRISRSVDMDAMKLVYDAAKYDKQVSETPYYGRTVESGTAMGFAKGISSEAMERGTFVNESNRELDGDEDEAYTSVAFQTGLNIRLVPAEQLEQVKKDEKGNIVLDEDGNEVKISTNGKYDRKTGTIYLADSNSFGDNVNIALSHEMTHHLAVFAPEAYMALSNYVMDRWYKLSPESYSQSIKNIQKLYKSVGQDLSEEEALEEIIADATRDFWNDPEFVKGFTTDNEPSVIKKVINAIKDVISKIRSILSLGNVSDEYEHYLWNILGDYTEAERLWLNAYKEAQTRASEKAIDEWQDNANEESAIRGTVSFDNADIDKLDKTYKEVDDSNGDPVAKFQKNGDVSFSISSYENEGRQIYKKYLDKLVSENELSQEEADQMLNELETIYDISKKFADKKDANGNPVYAPYTAWSYADVVRDAKGKPVFSSIRKNSEYKMNIDFSTICKKRRTLDAVFREMIRRGFFEKFDFNKDESAAMVVNINNLIRKNQFEAACALCFVEARRYRQQQTAKAFTEMWNNLVDSMYKDTDKIAYFNFGRDDQVQDVPDGIHTMQDADLDLSYVKKIANEKKDGKLKQTAEAKAARLMLNNPEQRKRMRVGDMMASTGFENMHIENPELEKVYNSKKGTGGAKSSFGDVQYLNEIINSRTFDRQKAYDVSGVRIQSFSDYVPRMVFDYVQVIADLAAKRLPAHAYTKEVLFVLQFGLTGAKVNMSLVPDVVEDGIAPGLDKDGNYAWNAEGTFPWEDYEDDKGRKWPGAKTIQKAEGYKKNCGTIAVGISDAQIMKMLADPEIQMVIPYHKSSLNPIVAAMTNVDRFTNYEDFQNTKNAEGKTVKTDFAWDKKLFGLTHYTRGEKKGELKPESEWGNVQDLVKQYVEWCDSKNYTPKFSQFLYLKENNDPDGDFVLDDDGNKIINPGYYKMLEDFALMDNDGNFKPQGDVKMQFPTAETGIDGMSMENLIERGLSDDTALEAMRSEKVGGIVDEIDKMFEEGTLTEQSVASRKLATKFSITPQQDDAYMDAVNSGNMEEAQRLVDEAAKIAGYGTRAYHGTHSYGFTKFDLYPPNAHRWGRNLGEGFYFTSNEEVARLRYGFTSVNDPSAGVYNVYLNLGDTLELDWSDVVTKFKKKADFDSYLDREMEDKDSLTVHNIEDGISIPSTVYVIKSNTQEGDPFMARIIGDSSRGLYTTNRVKSADTITYAEDGSVIPLSERFDPNNNDIRYSMPTTDADGNVLTDGQMEFFQNSQARDEQGRLVPVYHSTDEGGFTIFDPSVSEDERSVFFTDSRMMSESYIRYGETGDITPGEAYNYTQIIDVSDLPDNITNDKIFGIEVYSEDDGTITEGDDFLDAAADVARYFEEQGIEVEKEYAVDPEAIYNKNDDAMGEAIELFLHCNEIGLDYQMTYTGNENKESEVSGTYKCYLNLENPLIVDADGNLWDEIPFETEDRYENAYIKLEEKDGKRTLTLGYTEPVVVSVEDGYKDMAAKINDFLGFKENDSVGINIAYGFDWQVKQSPKGYVENHSQDIQRLAESEHYELRGEGLYTTREIAEIASGRGHDGVIIHNVLDYGSSGYADVPGNVYIAFKSNQIKDVNNENPTENPDIRFSIPPEDEAMSYEAHEYIYDDSPEALEYYETIIEQMSKESLSDGFINHPMQTFLENMRKYGKADERARKGKSGAVKYRNDRDFTSAFFDGLTWYDTGMKFDDPVLEEGRTRMAMSRNDFFNSNRAKWNQMWETNGEVLDVRSIRKPVKQLVMDTMRLAYTNTKYKNDIVNMTLIDMRMAYWYAQRGRMDVADALLWHTANRMVTSVKYIEDDTEFKRYKEIRDFIRHTNISMSEEYWADEQFRHFRKKHFGKLNITEGLLTNVDKVYQELEERWPDIFNEEQREKVGLVGNIKNFGDNNGDLLTHIGYVVDQNLTPFIEAYSSEEAAALTGSIASSLLDIMQENGEALQSKADRYVEQINAMKTRHEEALRKVREQRDKKVNLANEKLKTYKENERAKKTHTKYFRSIQKNYDKLKERLLSNTADKNIPEQYKKELAKVLAAFDLQTVGSKKWEERTGRKSQKSIKMAALKTALNNIEEKTDEFHVSDAITDIMEGLLGKNVGQGPNRSIEGLAIDELTIDELERIDKLLKALVHEFNTYKYIKINAKKQQTADIGKAQVEDALAHAEKYGAKKDFYSYLGLFDNIVNLDEMTAAYMFRKIDPNNVGMGLMFRELRRSFDHYVRNMAQLNQWMDEILEPYQNSGKGLNKYGADQIEQWRSFNYTQTFNLENGTVRLTPAQMMSVYCLAKRTQAYNHMTGAGIVVAPASFDAKMISDVKKKANTALPVKLTDADIKKITTALTPEQIQVAEQLQKLMADKMAAWGNEASMNVLGIELFGEPDYFPIKSDKAGLISDLDENQFVEAIRNFGFTKAVQPGAKNAIMVDDIFKIVAEHCNNMNLYNSYSESINDFMKVYNYRDFREDGSEYTVKQAIAHAYSQKATTFIMRFMKDLNGNVSGAETGISRMYNTLLSNAKKASVFANGRVALQQPTAITRAFAVIDPKYLKGVKIEKGAMKEMFEHCPIALWKSWGYYDIQMGRTIEDIMMNKGSLLEDVETWAYGALDNVTWTAIWQMVKAEMKDTHSDVKEGTDEYWDLCNERMSEIVDLTQVVDSPMHRSHGMRSKNFLEKTATAFMAEPTLTFNMVKDGVSRAREAWKSGNKAEAGRIAGRTMSVFLLQAATVSAMAAIWDAIRGKNSDDDDDDESKLRLWWINALENFKGELNILNKIYFVKDVSSLFEGYGVNNLALQGWKSIADGWAQLMGTRNVYSSKSWYENLFGGIGSILGVPIKTVLNDAKAIYNLFGLDWKVVNDLGEYLDKMALEPKDEKSSIASSFLSILDGKKNDETQESEADDGSLMDGIARKLGYKKIGSSADSMTESGDSETETSEMSEDEYRDSLPDNLTEEEKDEIVKAYERRTKKKAKEGGETSSEESIIRDKKEMLFDAEKAAAGYEGEERNKKIWESVSKGYRDRIAEGDYGSIYKMRSVVEQMGGDLTYFDQQVIKASKTALKKTIEPGGADTESEMVAQQNIRMFLERNGVSQEDISAMVYESASAKDLKVAFKLNDEKAIIASTNALLRAGLTMPDYERIFTNRNRIDLKKYNGKYKDRLKSTGNFVWPTQGTITSHFGYRDAPTAGASSNHPAIDIGAPQGTAVVAADGGIVISAGANGGYGNSVGIKHDNGMITWYNHLYDWNVREGDTVAQGQQIGQVGSTGISTGPHLDFKIVDTNGNPVDPEKYLS